MVGSPPESRRKRPVSTIKTIGVLLFCVCFTGIILSVSRRVPVNEGNRSSSERRVIQGMVVDPNGRPAAGAMVGVHQLPALEVLTDADGKFQLSAPVGVELSWPWSAQLSAQRMAYIIARDPQRDLAVASTLSPTASNLTIKLMPAVTVSGKVTDDQGKGIRGAWLSLVLQAGPFAYSLPGKAPRLDPNGCYEIRAVPPGHSYGMNVTAASYGQEDLQFSTPEVAHGRMELAPMTLRSANLDIGGIVVDANDRPMPNATVWCYDRGRPERRAITNAQGRFTAHGVCASPIQITATTAFQSDSTSPTELAPVVAGPPLFGSVQASGGATDVRIVVAQRVPGSYLDPKQVQLIGKPLPSMPSLGIDTSRDLYKGRMVLLCFFDANQRFSRTTLAGLVELAAELKQKDVMIMGVQMADAEGEETTQWLEDQRAVVQIALAKGNTQGIEYAWGVQLLPWLILADRDRLVRAEGFAIDDLNSVVEALK
jgi:hypothetical protein